jgi:hypothetical protein
LALSCHRNLLGKRPPKAYQFSGDRDDDQASEAFTLAHWGLPTDVLDRLGLCFASQLYVTTELSGIALGPRAFDERSPGVGVAGCGEGTLPASLTAGVCRGDEPQAAHHWSGVIEAREGAEFRPGGESPGELDAPQGLERCDDRM